MADYSDQKTPIVPGLTVRTLSGRQSTKIWLLLLVGLAVLLRLPTAGRESLWFDEAISYLTAVLPLPAILNNTVQSSHPPLYYLVLHFWLLWLPDGDIALRMVGLLWNILLVPVIYLLALELFGEQRVAFLAAFLVVVSPFHILYSHELRMYTQVMLLVSVATVAYLRARRTESLAWWVLFTAFMLAAVYTHLFSFLALAAMGIYALIYRHERRAFLFTVAATALIIFLFAPWLFILLVEAQKDLGSLRPLLSESGFSNPIKPLSSITFLLFGMSTSLPWTGLFLFLTLSLSVIFLLEIRKAKREGAAKGLLLPLLMVTFILGIPLTLYMARPFFLPERTMAAASPFAVLLISWGITRHRTPLPYLVYATAVIMLAGSLFYVTGDLIKPPYRDAVQFIDGNRAATDAVLHTSDGSYLPALRYATMPKHAVLAGDPDPRKPVAVYEALGGQVWSLEEATTAAPRLWLVVALEHSLEWQENQAAFFASRYHVLEQHNFGGIRVYLYEMIPLE